MAKNHITLIVTTNWIRTNDKMRFFTTLRTGIYRDKNISKNSVRVTMLH